MPADRYTWNEATEFCDLSKLQAPSCAGAADACFLLGVLEYLPNVEDAIRMIASLCDWIIFSYCSTDICSDRWHLRISAYSGAEIGSLVGLAGLHIEKCLQYKPGQYVMSARARTPISPEKRTMARQRVLPRLQQRVLPRLQKSIVANYANVNLIFLATLL